MKPRLLIVDDEAPARSRMKTLLADIAEGCPHELAGEAGSPREALDLIAALAPDIVLLDVQMPGMTGIELARHLGAAQSAPAVVFVTAFDEFALKAFEVHALDYLLKPVRAARLAEAIRRAASLRIPVPERATAAAAMMDSARRHFSVPERGRVRLVPVGDVLYLKAEQKYVTLRTAAQEFLIEESLTSIEEELGAVFIRVHRNALVARAAIAGVERAAHPVDGDGEGERGQDSWQVVLRGTDERLPISRRQWGVVKGLVR